MMIQGVLGPIDTAELGQTLMHEHITCADWSMRMNFGARFFEFDQVAEIAAGQLGKAKALGVRTVVDGTPVNLGRDIRLIREVARRTTLPEKAEITAAIMSMSTMRSLNCSGKTWSVLFFFPSESLLGPYCSALAFTSAEPRPDRVVRWASSVSWAVRLK